MQLGVAEGALSQVHLSLTVGTVATGLALLLGAGSFELGILAIMPVIGALMQFPAAWWVEWHGERRRASVVGSLGRLFSLVPVVLLFVPLPISLKLALFLLATALGNMLLAVATNAWTGWMTDLIPAHVRGQYFGVRGAVMSGVAMVVGYGGAWLVDRSQPTGLETLAYAGVMVFAVVCGAASSLLLARQPEPPMVGVTRHSLRQLIALPVHNQQFRAFASTFLLWQIGMGIASPFFIAYGLTSLRLPLQTLALLDAITALTGLLSQPRWGKLSDRIGARRTLLISMALIVPLPWAWLLATPERIWPLFISAALSGVMWAGFLLAQTNRMMEQAPADGRGAYFAAFSVATGVPFMLASLGAGALMSARGVAPITLAGLTFHPYLALFFLSGLLRLLSLLFGRKAV